MYMSDSGRRTRIAIEERHLTKEIAGAKNGQSLGRVVVSGNAFFDFYRAADDEVHGISVVALIEDNLLISKGFLLGNGCQFRQRLRAEIVKQRDGF